MGGSCYLPFTEEKFREIGFLSIFQIEHVRGYDTRSMARNKERARKTKIGFLLRCADKNAIPHFKKQRSSKLISMPFGGWLECIKDYYRLTLMECILDWKVDHPNIPTMLTAQKMALVEE